MPLTTRPDKDGAFPSYYSSDLTWALKYVYDLRVTHGVKVAAVNLSIGGGLFTGYCDGGWADGTAAPLLVGQWLDAVRSAGIAPVISSGNDGSATALGAPACRASAISVGNTTITPNGVDAVYYYSNSNATLDLLAPGSRRLLRRAGQPRQRRQGRRLAVRLERDLDGGASGERIRSRSCAATGRQRSVNQMERALKESGVRVYDSRNGITRSRIDVWSAINRLYRISQGA